MSNWFTDLLGAGAGYYNQDKAAQAALELGEQSAEKLYGLGKDVAGRAEFKPFTVTTGLGGATTTPEGGYSLQMSPEQQALQNQLLGQSQALFGQVGVDPSMAQADLYEQIRATQRPEEQRQALALEERMLSQGRLGLSSDAYGGASPELLAQETARQEAMARANLSARQQAVQEQQQAFGQGLGLLGQASGLRAQDLAEATGLLGAGYTPEQREIARAQAQLAGGLSQEQADLSRAGALFGAGMTEEQADFARAQGLMGASFVPRTQDLAMAQGMMSLGYMPQQQALGALGYGLEGAKLSDIGRRAGAEFYGQAGAAGIEALMQGMSEASGYDLAMKRGLLDTTSGMLSGGFDSDLSADSWSDMSDFERAMTLRDLYDKYKDSKG